MNFPESLALSLSFSNWCCCMCHCKSGHLPFLSSANLLMHTALIGGILVCWGSPKRSPIYSSQSKQWHFGRLWQSVRYADRQSHLLGENLIGGPWAAVIIHTSYLTDVKWAYVVSSGALTCALCSDAWKMGCRLENNGAVKMYCPDMQASE